MALQTQLYRKQGTHSSEYLMEQLSYKLNNQETATVTPHQQP